MFAHMPIIRDILLGAEKRKASLASMCKQLEIDPSEIYRSDIQVSFERAYRSWEIAVGQTGDPLLGLHLGEQTNASIMGMVGHLMQTCPNLEEAFKNVCQFSQLATDMFAYSIKADGDHAVLSFEPCQPWIKISPDGARQAVEQAMAGTLNVFKSLAGKKILPLQVLMSRGRPKDVSEYERVFQSPVKWNTDVNSLIFNRDLLTVPVVSYDESLMGMFSELLKQRAARIKTESSTADKVRQEIMTTFMGQLPGIESMAARLNTTVRSLQRKLDEEDVSYRQICSELGKDFALSLLKNPDTKIAEVASALGYADARAFQRAFKSWTGRTPGQFRGA